MILNDLTAALALIQSHDLIALDTETYAPEGRAAVDPFYARVRLLQLGALDSYPVILDAYEVDLLPVLEALNRPGLRKVMHNKKFDMKMIRTSYGVWLKECHCTLLMCKLVGLTGGYQSARIRGFGYKDMVRDYADVHLDKTEQRSDWSGELTPSQLEYAALDVGAPGRLGSLLLECYQSLYGVLHAPLGQGGYGMGRSHDLDEAAADGLARVELNGILVDRPLLEGYLKTLHHIMHQKLAALAQSLDLRVYPGLPYIGPDGEQTCEIEVPETTERLINNPVKLVALISSRFGKDLSNTQASTLEQLLKDMEEESEASRLSDDDIDLQFNIEVVSNLLQYKKAAKILSLRYDGMIHSQTGCIHAPFHEVGTGTDRMSSGSGGSVEGNLQCNAQQIPNYTQLVGI